jgi:hypothetical protein
MSRLYPCVYCTEDGYCKKYSDEEVTTWCVQSPCKDEKPSNADRIRSMTDEELADEILSWFNWLNAVEWDDKRIIEWLKQEVGE